MLVFQLSQQVLRSVILVKEAMKITRNRDKHFNDYIMNEQNVSKSKEAINTFQVDKKFILPVTGLFIIQTLFII